LAAFVLFSLHIASPRLPLILVASGSLGLAIATRYVGIALLPPMLFGLLLFGNRPLRHRITDILIAASVASVPIAVWLIRNMMMAHTATNRSFAVHPIGMRRVGDLIITLHDFVLPVPIPEWVKAINLMTLTGALLLTLAIMYRQRCIKPNTDSVGMIFSSLGILFSLVYIALVLVSISFFDAQTPLDRRICLPVFVLLGVATISLAWSLSQALHKPLIWWSFILCVLVSVGINGIPATKWAIHMHKNGIGYNSRRWNESMTLSLVKSFSQPVIIYSNRPDVIRFKTERDAIMIPKHTFPVTHKQNRNYQEQLQAMCKECVEGKAIVVYLRIRSQWYLPTENEMKLACELPILSQTEDGTIYGRNGKGAEQAAALDADSAALHPRQ
jgi:hypothetical protein